MTVVVGGDAQPRAQASALLRAAGFGMWVTRVADDVEAGELSDPGTIVVLLATGKAPARVRAVQKLAGSCPEAHIVVCMPADAPNSSLRRALRAGAAGIVFDGALERALVPTVQAVSAGQLAVPLELRSQLAPRALSYREKQILGLVVLGFTNREIADKLYLAESTVKTHLSSAFAKLDAHSRAEAAARILDPEGGYGVGILAIANGDAAPAG
jgi:DNA-binding NarL/FixJ family response regulator